MLGLLKCRLKLGLNPGCFVAGTQVVTRLAGDGSLVTRNIEDLRVGDYVVARDQYDAGDDLDLRRVSQVFRKTSDHVRVLTLRTADGQVETIRTTNEHPFWREGSGWTGAGGLVAGDRVDLLDGRDATVTATERIAHPEGVTVYNFEVEGDHTYFVADADGSFNSAVWVHNANPCNIDIRPYIKSFALEGNRWTLIRVKVEAATGMRNRGGQSMQELFRRDDGIEMVRHTLFKADGNEFESPHFRAAWK